MAQHQVKTSNNNLYDRKNEPADLIPKPGAGIAAMTLDELESMRLDRTPTTASRHALEVICGASCETGAQ